MRLEMTRLERMRSNVGQKRTASPPVEPILCQLGFLLCNSLLQIFLNHALGLDLGCQVLGQQILLPDCHFLDLPSKHLPLLLVEVAHLPEVVDLVLKGPSTLVLLQHPRQLPQRLLARAVPPDVDLEQVGVALHHHLQDGCPPVVDVVVIEVDFLDAAQAPAQDGTLVLEDGAIRDLAVPHPELPQGLVLGEHEEEVVEGVVVEVVAADVQLGQGAVLLHALAEVLEVLAAEAGVGDAQPLEPPVLVQVVLDVEETVALVQPVAVQVQLLQRLVAPDLPTQPLQPHRRYAVLPQQQLAETSREPVLAVVYSPDRLCQRPQPVPVERVLAQVQVLYAHAAQTGHQLAHALVADFVLGQGQHLQRRTVHPFEEDGHALTAQTHVVHLERAQSAVGVAEEGVERHH